MLNVEIVRGLGRHSAGDAGDSSEPIRPIVDFWGSKVPQNGRFPALDADEPPCKIDAASFIFSGEIIS